MDIVIRKFKAGDEEGIFKLINLNLKKGNFGFIGRTKVSKKDVQRWRKVNLSGENICFVAEDKGRIVGSFAISPHGKKTRLSHVGTCGWLIEPAYHGKGIASKAMKKAIAAARKIGLKRVEAEICCVNTSSIKLARKLGMKKEGVKKKAFRTDDGVYRDTIVVGRFLK